MITDMEIIGYVFLFGIFIGYMIALFDDDIGKDEFWVAIGFSILVGLVFSLLVSVYIILVPLLVMFIIFYWVKRPKEFLNLLKGDK